MGGLGETDSDTLLASVVRYTAVVEMNNGVGLRYRHNRVSTVCATLLRDTGEVYSVLH